MKLWWLGKAVKFLGFLVIMFIVLGAAVMLLWNALIPDIFHGPTVTFAQAVGLLVLAHILVRGWGGRWHGGWRHNHWKHRMEEKLAAMTPEEREKFKAEWNRRCHHHEPEKEK